jgi:hypothetical protein
MFPSSFGNVSCFENAFGTVYSAQIKPVFSVLDAIRSKIIAGLLKGTSL